MSTMQINKVFKSSYESETVKCLFCVCLFFSCKLNAMSELLVNIDRIPIFIKIGNVWVVNGSTRHLLFKIMPNQCRLTLPTTIWYTSKSGNGRPTPLASAR